MTATIHVHLDISTYRCTYSFLSVSETLINKLSNAHQVQLTLMISKQNSNFTSGAISIDFMISLAIKWMIQHTYLVFGIMLQ